MCSHASVLADESENEQVNELNNNISALKKTLKKKDEGLKLLAQRLVACDNSA